MLQSRKDEEILSCPDQDKSWNKMSLVVVGQMWGTNSDVAIPFDKDSYRDGVREVSYKEQVMAMSVDESYFAIMVKKDSRCGRR